MIFGTNKLIVYLKKYYMSETLKIRKQSLFSHSFFALLSGLGFLMVFFSEPAFAQSITISDISENIVDSIKYLPSLIASICYLAGIYFGIMGILKVVEHMDNPNQGALKSAAIRFLVGGGLFALPIVFEAMYVSITKLDPTATNEFEYDVFSPTFFVSGLLGGFSGLLGSVGVTMDFNAVLSTFNESIKHVPSLIGAISSLAGLILGVEALFKLKDHIDNPDQNPFREVAGRFLIGGALIAIPTIYTAMATAISGGDGIGLSGILTGALSLIGMAESGYDQVNCSSSTLGAISGTLTTSSTDSVGGVLCGIMGHTGALPWFLSNLAYVFGLVLGLWALFKFRDNIVDPKGTPITEGVSRLVAGGAFFALPVVMEAIRGTVTPLSGVAVDYGSVVSGYNAGGVSSCSSSGGGLDERLFCSMTDILGPFDSLINFFALVAGIVFIMIGISRLLKSEQDGARGPGGMGTIMTFTIGGVLISFSEFMRLITSTIFSTTSTATFATLQYTSGMSAAEVAHAHMVISGILKFMIIIGLISFARGLFIIRGASEGDNQSSLMAGVTHIVGGALAVNLGPLINAVQVTLGITSYGVVFG